MQSYHPKLFFSVMNSLFVSRLKIPTPFCFQIYRHRHHCLFIRPHCSRLSFLVKPAFMNTPLPNQMIQQRKLMGFFQPFRLFSPKKELLGDFGHFLARFENSFASVSMAEAEVSRRPAQVRSRCGVDVV